MKPWRVESFVNPNGIPASSPGLAHSAYPGVVRQYVHNPEGVAATHSPEMPQPRWGWPVSDAVPKVGAGTRQPWALGRIPVRIGERPRLESAAGRGNDAGKTTEESAPDEEYEIYEAVLTQKFDLGQGSFVVIDEMLIPSQVDWLCEEMKKPRVAGQGSPLCMLSESCLADFLNKGKRPSKLGKCFRPSFGYQILSEEESDEIWEPPPGQNAPHDGWAVFHKRFEYAAWVSLSRAGFDAGHTQALIEAGLLVDGEAGEGGLFLLSRVNGEWKIIGELVSWIA
jgi:hypothetical protein